MKKPIKQVAKPRNTAAAALANPLFKQRIVKDPTKYTRKLKHKPKSI